MQKHPAQLRYGDLLVLEVTYEGRARWARCRCVRIVEGRRCGKVRRTRVSLLRKGEIKACADCMSAARGAGNGEVQTHYRNGQRMVTKGGYKRRLSEFSPEQRREYDRIVSKRRERDYSPQGWAEVEREAVELVVMSIGVKECRPIELAPSTDYSWMYRG